MNPSGRAVLRLSSFMTELRRVYLWIAFICVIGFLLCAFTDVIFRQIVQKPLLSATDLAIFFFVWSVLAGMAVGVRDNLHFNLDVLSPRSSSLRKIRAYVVDLFTLVFFAAFTYLSTETAYHAINRAFPMTGYPLVFVVSALPITGIGGCLFSVERLIQRAAGIEGNQVDAAQSPGKS